jgi:hypothetical protein
MELQVLVIEAQGLKNVGGKGLIKKKGDLSDPYVVVEYGGQKYYTSVNLISRTGSKRKW